MYADVIEWLKGTLAYYLEVETLAVIVGSGMDRHPAQGDEELLQEALGAGEMLVFGLGEQE
ncbi:MAG: hypothetical protein A2Y73_08950 [Chloroflexi bacterium RBG_13_56_8]|nr:MAG: hypothetical protein A2Y73_08950 [Chloroflexi bacterium RBG_13_56_8]